MPINKKSTNLFSPDAEWQGTDTAPYYSEERGRLYAERMQNLIDLNPNINYGTVDGYLQYQSDKKAQMWTMRINSVEEALTMANFILNWSNYDPDTLNAVNERTWRNLFLHAGGPNHRLLWIFKDYLDTWIRPDGKGRGKLRKIKNPKTNRYVKKTGKTYKDIFGDIKLKSASYPKLQTIDTIDYDINKYCVPSFFSQKLKKSEYAKIKSDLDDIKTPTYPELTKILNKINYNLNVYIIDKECIQEQTEYKKKFNILIKNEHMYVLNNRLNFNKTFPTVEVSDDEFKKIDTEIYTNSHKIYEGTQYKIKNKFLPLEKSYNLKGPYSQVNIDFYYKSNIRPVRYINKEVESVEGVDIDKCYMNILNNPDYIYPVQDGTEQTETFNKEDVIKEHGFYYSVFKAPTEADKAFFGDAFWILGYVIKKLKLEKKITIKYKHVAKSARVIISPDNHDYIDIIHYTGHLASHQSYKEKYIKCEGIEQQAFYNKYINDDVFCTENGIFRSSSKFLRTSGMYAYMAILQYARLQLYTVYQEVVKVNKGAKIRKIYTDSIIFNKDITLNDDIKTIEKNNKIKRYPEKLNKRLKKHHISVKLEHSQYTWTQTDYTAEVPEINNKIDNIETDIYKFLGDKSFCINASAGYGKSYTLKNIIIPFLDKNNKRYMISSTTIENTKDLTDKDIKCNVINSIIALKDHSIKYLSQAFNGIDYIIIDEASRLNMHLMNTLEFIKNSYDNIKFILIGDSNQCDYDNKNYMESTTFKKLVDYNILNIEWHPNARYSKEYDEFLSKLLTFSRGGRDNKCINHVKEFFKDNVKPLKNYKKDKNNIKLSFTHKTGGKLGEYMTVHKSQGKTINEKYSIYEINKMSIKTLYTALSRATDPELIDIYI